MQKEIITEEQQKAARYAKAMGHPIRMYVLELLSKQSCCYSGDLTEDLPIVKSTGKVAKQNEKRAIAN